MIFLFSVFKFVLEFFHYVHRKPHTVQVKKMNRWSSW